MPSETCCLWVFKLAQMDVLQRVEEGFRRCKQGLQFTWMSDMSTGGQWEVRSHTITLRVHEICICYKDIFLTHWCSHIRQQGKRLLGNLRYGGRSVQMLWLHRSVKFKHVCNSMLKSRWVARAWVQRGNSCWGETFQSWCSIWLVAFEVEENGAKLYHTELRPKVVSTGCWSY